jgi:hypothetical protein
MGPRRVLGVLVALSSIWLAVPAVAARAGAPLRVRLKYRLVAHGVVSPSVSGPYLGFSQYPTRGPERFVLIDERTGKRIVMPRGCEGGVVGVPWVALYCGESPGPLFNPFYGLYNIETRTLRRFPCDAVCQQDFDNANLLAVGARWLELQLQPDQPCGDGVHYTCGPPTDVYYDVRTGRPRVPSTSPSAIVDLNSPTLTRPPCRPLIGPLWWFDGTFALAQEANGMFLERCGSDIKMPLVTASNSPGSVLANTEAVASCSDSSTQASGIFLPSLRRFTFTVATNSFNVPACPTVLGQRYVYYDDAQERLWAAPFASQPSPSRSHHAGDQALGIRQS